MTQNNDTRLVERLRHMADNHHAIKDSDAMSLGADRIESLTAEVERKDAAISEVLAYREGRKPHDFHRLPDDQRANEAFDAWQKVEANLRAALESSK